MKYLSLVILLMLSACGPGPIYQWGNYEKSILKMYSDDFSPQEEIARLSREIEKTEQKEKLVPPGKRLHLGYLCYVNGDTDSAKRWFEQEKAAFPESAAFVNGLIERMKK